MLKYAFNTILILLMLSPGFSMENPYMDQILEYNSVMGEVQDSLKKDKKAPFLGLGLQAGLNLATGAYSYQVGPPPPSMSILYGAAAEITLDWRFSRSFTVFTTLSYQVKGDRINMQSWYDRLSEPSDLGEWEALEPLADGSIKTRVGYLEASLSPVIKMGEWVYLGFGAYAAVGINGLETSDYVLSFYLDDLLVDIEQYNRVRYIDFATYLAVEDDEYSRYFNLLDYGILGFLGIGKRPVTLELGVSYGLEYWEPELTLFNEGPPLNRTRHLCGTVRVNFWLW
jgi:hypothetical protein